MKTDTDNGNNESDINIDGIEESGDEMDKKGQIHFERWDLILIGIAVVCLIIFLKFGIYDKWEQIKRWLSDNALYVIGIIIGIVMIYFGSSSAMRFRRSDRVGGGIALIILGVFIITLALVAMGVITP